MGMLFDRLSARYGSSVISITGRPSPLGVMVRLRIDGDTVARVHVPVGRRISLNATITSRGSVRPVELLVGQDLLGTHYYLSIDGQPVALENQGFLPTALTQERDAPQPALAPGSQLALQRGESGSALVPSSSRIQPHVGGSLSHAARSPARQLVSGSFYAALGATIAFCISFPPSAGLALLMFLLVTGLLELAPTGRRERLRKSGK